SGAGDQLTRRVVDGQLITLTAHLADRPAESGSVVTIVETFLGHVGHRRRGRRRAGPEVAAVLGRDQEPQRNGHDRHQDGDEGEHRHRDPPRHYTSPSRKPRPYTVSIRPGTPSLRRSDVMCTSRTLVGPYQFASQAASRISWRLRPRPGSSARTARMSNSFGVSATGCPDTATFRARRSTVRRP